MTILTWKRTKNLEIKFQLSWQSHPRLDASGYMDLHLFPLLLLLLLVACCCCCFFSFVSLSFFGEQGWCSGESARLPPMCPGFDSRTRRHMWAEFVGSLLCSERFFSGNSGFPLSSKTNIWFDLIWFIWFTVSPISTALVLG